MDDKELLDIYADYLISSFGLTTGTGLSRLLVSGLWDELTASPYPLSHVA